MKEWKKIWTEVAEAFDTPHYKQTEKQKAITDLGLCHALRYMGKRFNIPQKIALGHPGFWWSRGGDPYRATFAGFMAAMGDKGFADFLKWCESNPDRKE